MAREHARASAGECVHARSSRLRAYLPACCASADQSTPRVPPTFSFVSGPCPAVAEALARCEGNPSEAKHARTLQLHHLTAHPHSRVRPPHVFLAHQGLCVPGWASSQSPRRSVDPRHRRGPHLVVFTSVTSFRFITTMMLNTSAAALSSSRPVPAALRTVARHAPMRVRRAPVMKIDYVNASEVGVGSRLG